MIDIEKFRKSKRKAKEFLSKRLIERAPVPIAGMVESQGFKFEFIPKGKPEFLDISTKAMYIDIQRKTFEKRYAIASFYAAYVLRHKNDQKIIRYCDFWNSSTDDQVQRAIFAAYCIIPPHLFREVKDLTDKEISLMFNALPEMVKFHKGKPFEKVFYHKRKTVETYEHPPHVKARFDKADKYKLPLTSEYLDRPRVAHDATTWKGKPIHEMTPMLRPIRVTKTGKDMCNSKVKREPRMCSNKAMFSRAIPSLCRHHQSGMPAAVRRKKANARPELFKEPNARKNIKSSAKIVQIKKRIKSLEKN